MAILQICFERTRVAVEILFAVELNRIDEQSNHDVAALLAGAADECGMAFVQRTHGRDNAHGQSALAGGRDQDSGVGDSRNHGQPHSGLTWGTAPLSLRRCTGTRRA
jgi:hypothetical protein